jgi:hypothetical protein
MSKLHLQPKSDEEIHAVLSNFELKWQHKARRARGDGRISRFE